MKKKLSLQKVYNPKYRYFCPACTDVAYYSASKEVGKLISCMNCGKRLITEKKNFIKL